MTKQDDLQAFDDRVLRAIHELCGKGSPPTYLEIAPMVDCVSPTTVMNSVERLEAAGLLTRERRRHRTTRLTDAGLKKLEELDAVQGV